VIGSTLQYSTATVLQKSEPISRWMTSAVIRLVQGQFLCLSGIAGCALTDRHRRSILWQ
jgi:hypothetical protein